MNGDGAEVLVGITSKHLGETCSRQDHAVYTSTVALLPWIEAKIKDNGGMSSCSNLDISAPPVQSNLLPNNHYNYKDMIKLFDFWKSKDAQIYETLVLIVMCKIGGVCDLIA